MSERTHSTFAPHSPQVSAPDAGSVGSSPGGSSQKRRKLTILLAGTAVAGLAAAVLIQIFRAEPASSGVDRAEPSEQAAGRASVEKPLARVNGELIGWRDVALEAMDRYGRDVLENIINRMIIQQACQERGIVVTNAEVDAEILRIAQKFGLTVANWYQMLQKERGISPVQYRRDIIWPMLALRKIAGTNIEVTDEDRKRTFEREYGPRVKAKMIMLDNFRRATEVQEMARRNPDDFGRLARQHSVDPTSRALDGDIPPIRRHAGNPDLVEKAFELREGEISAVIQVGYQRWVILKCEGRTVPVVKNYSEVAEVLEEQIREEKIQETVARVFERLKRNARVDNFLTGASTGLRTSESTGRPGTANIRSATRSGSYPSRASVGGAKRQ